MQYPALPTNAKCINFASSGAYSPFFDIVWSFDYAIVGGSGTEGGFALFIMENVPLTGGNPGIDLGYSGLSSVDSQYSVKSGIPNTVLGVGFDSTGLFAASASIGSVVIRDGIKSEDVIKNSVTIRSGISSLYSYEEYDFTAPLSSLIDEPFNIIEGDVRYKTIRARLGNLGRTFYVDYRNNSNEYFRNILTKDVTLYPTITSMYKVGVSFATPIGSSSSLATGRIYIKNFHVEGEAEDKLYSGCSDNCDAINIESICDIDLGLLPSDYRCLTFNCVSAAPVCLTEPCAGTSPNVINFNTTNFEEGDSSNIYGYLSEGNTVGVDTCNITTCINTATGVDLFNFGYKLSVIELNTTLERYDIFAYKNSSNTVTAYLPAFGDSWKITTGVNTYTSSSATPAGLYTGTSNLSVIYVS
jgi:hypothetical protein